MAAVFSLLVMAATAGPFLDNETLHANQDPHTETRRSDHFRLAFGHHNRDTGAPMTEELAQGNLQMFEQMWRHWVEDLGLRDINESATNPDGNKYRANFVFLMTWDDGGGGGAYMSMDANGFAWAMSNPSNCRFDPPSGATPHEFGHVWQGTAGGFNGTDSSGAWWENHANWMQLQFLNSCPHAGGHMANSMYYPAHGRRYYDDWTIWETAMEDPRYGADWINEVWTHATPAQKTGEYIIDRMIRLDRSGSADKAAGINDLWGDMAKRMVTWDFRRQRWLSGANIAETSADWWSWYQRSRTPMVRMAGTEDLYRPARAHLPQQFGLNVIPLTATPGTTVECTFEPFGDPMRNSDWRAVLVAVSSNNDARYSEMWNAGTNAISLSNDETQLYLVVIATPRPMKVGQMEEYRLDSGSQFPYAVSFSGATPRNAVFPKPSVAGASHSNGGGFVASTATVDASAYVGPDAMVLDTAQVRNDARIEDHAVVRHNARVRDHAVVSGHAMVQDTAQVYGNAKVRDWARVFGNAEVCENARVIEHANCGDNGIKVYGHAVIKGTTYVYATSTIAGCSIWEGDTANGGTLVERGVTFGWSWGFNAAYFAGLADNNYVYAQHTFEKDHPVWAWDEFGINHGFLMNGARAGVDPARGGRVLPLNGSSQYVELHNSVNDWKDTAVATWVKWAGGADDQRVWSFGDGAGKQMYLTPLDTSTGRLRFVITNGTTSETLDGVAALPVNTWTHVAVVFSGSSRILYVNGSPVATATGTLWPDQLNAPRMANANYLGRGNDGHYFSGALDDFRVYMKALNAVEVAAVHALPAPSPVTLPSDTTPPSPNAAAWLVAPAAVPGSDAAITMSAVRGADASGWVEYAFECVSGGGNDSGWVSSNLYTDAGLEPGTTYTYRVRMRDRNGNTTAFSSNASATTRISSIGAASFAYGPAGIANGQVRMRAQVPENAVGKIEYKFDRTAPGSASSGWQASPTWNDSGLGAGVSCSYTVTLRDSRGNTSAPSAPVATEARDLAPPALPIPEAYWSMRPYATIDNGISMTAMTATDPAGVQYLFQCTSGNGPDSAWQDSATFRTSALPVGTYTYRYKLRDRSAQSNESGWSAGYTATVTTTSGHHRYGMEELPALADDDLVDFDGTVIQVKSDHYVVRDLSSGTTITVHPSTYGRVTDAGLVLKNVRVKGHLYTFDGTRTVTYATVDNLGDPALYTVSGRVADERDEGISGATVYFSYDPDPAASPVVTATTDANGYYSRPVLNGEWYVAASASTHNSAQAQRVVVENADRPGIHFTLADNVRVSGQVVHRDSGAPVAGAQVVFSTSPNASASPTFTATTDAGGLFSQPVQNGTWYVAAGSPGHYVSRDQTVGVAGADVGGLRFSLTSNARDIPLTGNLIFSAVTDVLPSSGPAGAWATYQPAGLSLSPIASPAVEIAEGRQWVRTLHDNGDGFELGTYADPIPCDGATAVIVVKPERNSLSTSWTSCVDVFYNRLVLGVRNSTGRVDVWRNGQHYQSASAIPGGQSTVLSLVVQPNGTFAVFANGTSILIVTETSDMTALVPNVPGGFANGINVGRNKPDGWTTFNGLTGDVFLYNVALSTSERQQLETDLFTKFGIGTVPEFTLTASAGAGGTISPYGTTPVPPGGSQTFSMAPGPGHVLLDVKVDGVSVGAPDSYTFSGVGADHAIMATFALSAMENWRREHFEGNAGDDDVAGPLADPDEDGAVNLMEFALRGDPNAQDAEAIAPHMRPCADTGLPALAFRVRAGGHVDPSGGYRADGIVYSVFMKDRLEPEPDWVLFPLTEPLRWEEDHDGVPLLCVPVDTGPGAAVRFLRLKVSMDE